MCVRVAGVAAVGVGVRGDAVVGVDGSDAVAGSFDVVVVVNVDVGVVGGVAVTVEWCALLSPLIAQSSSSVRQPF